MKKSNSKSQKSSVNISIQLPGAGAPPKLLANASLEFTTGLLQGLKLNGFALWRAEQATTGRRFISVTLPSNRIDGAAGYRYIDHIRGQGDDVKRLKGAIVAAFRAAAEAQGIEDVPAPEEGIGDSAAA